MLLVIDIGNTNLVFGVFEGDQLRHSWRVATRKDETSDEFAVRCHDLFRLDGLSTDAIEDIVLCSVVPPLNGAFRAMARDYFSIDPIFVEPAEQDLISVLYNPPVDVGADRVVSALAAFEMLGGPVIVVDFGTATTFDAISARGEYLGGIIAPGMRISAEALFSRAARLPRVDMSKPERVIGDSTVGSMQSGIYYGYVGLVEGILTRMCKELKEAQVIATGGLASLVAGEVEQIVRIEENLILYGLQIFHSLQNRKHL